MWCGFYEWWCHTWASKLWACHWLWCKFVWNVNCTHPNTLMLDCTLNHHLGADITIDIDGAVKTSSPLVHNNFVPWRTHESCFLAIIFCQTLNPYKCVSHLLSPNLWRLSWCFRTCVTVLKHTSFLCIIDAQLKKGFWKDHQGMSIVCFNLELSHMSHMYWEHVSQYQIKTALKHLISRELYIWTLAHRIHTKSEVE